METTPPPTPDLNNPPPSTYQKPADYYSDTTLTPERSGCPKWVPISCGIAAVVLLLCIFGFGAWMMKGGANKVLHYAFSQVQNEMPGMYTADVPVVDRARLESEMSELRRNVDSGKVGLPDAQGILQKLKDDTSDKRLTPDEVTDLTESLQKINGERGGR